MRLSASIDLAWVASIVPGMYLAAFGWRPAAWILVGTLTMRIAGHVVTGSVIYLRTIQRPWPAVAALSFDDDD